MLRAGRMPFLREGSWKLWARLEDRLDDASGRAREAGC